jgi:uncharacterized DUF497 family protein
MEFEWDQSKSDVCLADRGFDFSYAVRAFLDEDRLIRQDHRWEYGEDRYQLLGKIEGRIFHLVYTLRKNRIRIISARKANYRGAQDYEDRTH